MMDHIARLERLRSHLASLQCEALLIENPIDLLYLTGLELSPGKLIVSQSDACLIVPSRDHEYALRQTTYPVLLLNEYVLNECIVETNIHQIAFDQHHTSYQDFINLNQLAATLKSNAYSLDLLPLESPIQHLRFIKDREEIAALRQAAHLGYQGYEYVASLLREGVTESELAFELEFFWKKKGGSRLAFDSIIAFGPNSSMPHYRAGSTPLTSNTLVLIDIGVVLSHYHSDMTRTLFFGTPSPQMKGIYSIVEEAKEKALALCKPGTRIGDLDRVARESIASKGYGDYFTHSLGHGIGLEIHESPILRQNGIHRDLLLQPGMVITIEPGIYLPKIGGVRLEDTILITENGYENLTCPKLE